MQDLLTQSLNKIQRSLSSTIDEQQHLIDCCNRKKVHLTKLKPTSISETLTRALRPYEQKLLHAESALENIKSEGKWKKFRIWREAVRTHKTAKSNLIEQENIANNPENIKHRIDYVNAHNIKVEDARKESVTLSELIEETESSLTKAKKIKAHLDILEETIQRRGWVSHQSYQILENIHQHLISEDIAAAFDLVRNLAFQTMPSHKQIEAWCAETEHDISKARAEGSVGFCALASYTAIVQASTELALSVCNDQIRSEIKKDFAPEDRWYHIVHEMTTPEHFFNPIQWALYWAGFKCSQAFSRSHSLAKAHEEHRTGEFLSLFRQGSQEWAGPKIDAMGYPNLKSMIGTLSLGGGVAESSLGADFGIIIDINVGELNVRKVALVQSKLSSNGVANIGSKPSGMMKLTQLEKLSDPQRDFYIFYHRGVRHASSPWPTVSRVHKLVSQDTNLKASYVNVSTRDSGWDWPSFFAFGLCNKGSGIGREITEHEDALSILGGEARDTLPDYLIFVAAGGGDYSLHLQQRVAEHYSDFGTAYEHKRNGRNDPGFKGMGHRM